MAQKPFCNCENLSEQTLSSLWSFSFTYIGLASLFGSHKRIITFCLPWQQRIIVLNHKVQTFWVIHPNIELSVYSDPLRTDAVSLLEISVAGEDHHVWLFPQFPWIGQTSNLFMIERCIDLFRSPCLPKVCWFQTVIGQRGIFSFSVSISPSLKLWTHLQTMWYETQGSP